MKKVLSLILTMILTASLCIVSFGEEPEEIPGTVDIPYAGFRFVPPESFQDTTGIVAMESTLEIGDGIFFTSWTYAAMTEEEWNAVLSDHHSDAPADVLATSLFGLFSIGNGISFTSFSALNGNAIPAENIREIGKLGGFTYCLYMTGPNEYFLDAIEPIYRDEYIALANAADDIASGFVFYNPQEKPDPYAGLIGVIFDFTAADLDGNPVSSAEMFAQSEITMVNIWTTWCAPCIEELPELQEIHTRLQEKGCSVVGMLADDDLNAARRLIEEKGVAYPVIVAPDTLNDLLLVEYVPTTLFVGRDGTVLASPIIGAHEEEYETVIDSLLNGK